MDLILTLSTIKAFPIDILVSGPVQLEKEHVGRRILLLSHYYLNINGLHK